MIRIFMTIFSQFNTENTSNVARLEKQVPKSPFEQFCNKVCPYLIISFSLILIIFLFVILVRYGHSITGTEANQYYYHLQR